MNYIRNIGFLFLLMLCQNVFSGSGLFFDVSASGTPGSVDISLCLNGKGPLSCQNYHVSALTLSIRTTPPNRTYPLAGIKVHTPGYTLANLGVDCTLWLPTGYCLFAASNTTSKTLDLITAGGSLSISPSTLPNATAGVPYSVTITASGGFPPYTFTISSGQLPPGLTLDSTTGVVSGIPTSGGTYNFTLAVADSNKPIPHTGAQPFSLTVNGFLTLNPPTLPEGELSTAYNATITASGGVGPYTFAVTSGALPPGLILNSDGAISGIPTSVDTYSFTVTGTDAEGKIGSKIYSVVISGALTLSPPTLPAGQLSTVYNQIITASGGVGPYTFEVTSGTIPPGLFLNSNGTITGTPTSIGTYPVTITATDTMSSDTGFMSYFIVVSGSLTLSPPTLLPGHLSTAYHATIKASGGVGPYTFTVTSGIFPPGLTLNSDGTIAGTPTSIGTYDFTIMASDTMSSATGSIDYSIVISGSLILSPPTLLAGELSTPYNATITASGGVGPYTFAVTSAILPPGLFLNSNGTITGTPTTIGTYHFTITASDTMSSATGSVGYSIVVSGSLTLSPPTLPPGELSTAYGQTITASGGVGPYTFAVTSEPFPPGLTLNSNGTITGTPTTIGTYDFTITATDTMSSATGSVGYSIVVSGSLTLSPPTLPPGELSTPYNATIAASGGIGPYTFAVTSAILPPGLFLDSNGTITGTPTNVGTYDFTITATDTMSSATGSVGYSIVVSGSLTLSPPTLPSGRLSTPYNATITASGGIGPYTFEVNSGVLPTGLILNTNGTLTGTPTTSGSYPFTIRATDTNSSATIGSQAYTITVFPFVYVTNYGTNRVLSCTVTSVGILVACTTLLDNLFSGPHGIVLNAASTLAYVTNYTNNTVAVCPIKSDGTFDTCTFSNPGTTFNKPQGIVLNSVNSLAYVTNTSANNVSICPIKLDGMLDTCTLAGGSFIYPAGIDLNSDNTLAYITNYKSFAGISVCLLNTDGSLGACNPQANVTFNGPAGIELNAANTRIYVSNHDNNTVSVCSLSVDGTLLDLCTAFLGNFSGPQGTVLNAANTFLYVANVFNNTISICSVPNGPLDSCIVFNPGNLNQPADIALG